MFIVGGVVVGGIVLVIIVIVIVVFFCIYIKYGKLVLLLLLSYIYNIEYWY